MSGSIRTIARELVHKHAGPEVLVTGVAPAEQGWVLNARLPRRHRFHRDTVGRQAGYHDPLLVLEAFRQGCIAASHVFYRVPLDFRFVLRYYQFTVLDMAALESSSGTADFEFRTEVRKEHGAGAPAAVSGLEVVTTAVTRGVGAMELSGAFGWIPAEQWRLIRTGAAQAPPPQPSTLDPLTVNRTRPANVVIGEPAHDGDDLSTSAPIVVDTGNRTFFDHALDHLPGSLILEACRQLALAAMGPDRQLMVGPARMRCEFHAFAELAPACMVTLAPSPDGLTFRARVTQAGQPRATVDLAFDATNSRP